MTVLPGNYWQDVATLTWNDLADNLWLDFRLSLYDVETEQMASGVAVKTSYTTAKAIAEFAATGVKILQSPVINRTESEMVVSIVVSSRDYKSVLINHLLKFQKESKTFVEIMKAYDREFRRLEQDREIIKRNMFLDTAIERLNIYERDLAIESINYLDYRQRREQVGSRNRASFEQTTEETIKNVASGYSNGEVEVNVTDTVGLYEIKFIGSRGVPDNLKGLKNALDIVIPAHLGLTYVFTYNNWGFVNGRKWSNVAPLTWDELQIWDGVS